MSQHGCPERLSNRSKGFQDDGPSQSTMEVLVETLTGTAFEMTVLPTDTIFAIKSKIFRVEGIPVSQQHLLYNLKELDDASSLREHAIGDGARLRLVLGMRGGPISTRRLPPPPSAEPWRDIERLLDTNRDDVEWGGSGCKVTVLVFRDGERVNMLRVKENNDGTYSPLEQNKCPTTQPVTLRSLLASDSPTSSSLPQLVERSAGGATLQDNAVTMTKMLELRRRMESLSVQRTAPRSDKADMQKTRSEESLSVASLLEEGGSLKQRAASYAPMNAADDFAPLYDGRYTRYHCDCALLPPLTKRNDSEQSVQDVDTDTERIKLSDALAGPILVQGRREAADEAAILEECLDTDQCLRQDQELAANVAPVHHEYGRRGARRGPQSASASSLHARAPLSDALFSSSTSDLEKLKRNTRILPALSRHRPREHLHLSDERLELEPAPAAPRRARCGLCRRRLSIATAHRCRCGGAYCAPHRYAEVHGCAYDYRAAPRLPRI